MHTFDDMDTCYTLELPAPDVPGLADGALRTGLIPETTRTRDLPPKESVQVTRARLKGSRATNTFATLELFNSAVSDIADEARRTGFIPEASRTRHLSPEESAQVTRAWLEGSRAIATEGASAYRDAWAAKGWAFQWFRTHAPRSAAETSMAEAMEEAIDVVDRYYPALESRGMKHFEDMGILQHKGWGGSEGVQIKREAYGTMILVSVYAVTGPTNFDASDGSLEFEPGSKSSVFHLAYAEMPSSLRLLGDIAAYPLVSAKANRLECKGRAQWSSDGWSGPAHTAPYLHRPWDTLRDASLVNEMPRL